MSYAHRSTNAIFASCKLFLKFLLYINRDMVINESLMCLVHNIVNLIITDNNCFIQNFASKFKIEHKNKKSNQKITANIIITRM